MEEGGETTFPRLPAPNGEGAAPVLHCGVSVRGSTAVYCSVCATFQAQGLMRFLLFMYTLTKAVKTAPGVPALMSACSGDNGPGFSECARRVLAVKPERGSALLFHSLTLSGQREDRSLHSACPVLRGVKWSAPKCEQCQRSSGPPCAVPWHALGRAGSA